MPEYEALFKEVHSASFLAVLGALGEVKDGEGFLAEARRHFRGKVFRVCEAKAFQRLWVDPTTYGYVKGREAIASRLSRAAQRYQLLLGQEELVAQRLRAFYAEVPYSDFMDSIPGSSSLQNAIVLGVAGDLKLYDASRCLTKLAGLNPCEYSSGFYQGSTRISKAGRSRLRLAAMTSVMALLKSSRDHDFSRRFFYLRTRPENPLSSLQALVACANKYLRTMWWLAIHQTSYDAAISARGLAWAKAREQKPVVQA